MEKILVPIFDKIQEHLDAIDENKFKNENEIEPDTEE